MKLTITAPQNQPAVVFSLVDQSALEQLIANKSIETLSDVVTATQFKAQFSEQLPLIGLSTETPFLTLLGLGDTEQLAQKKLATLAQHIITVAQKKHAAIEINVAALPAKFQYIFALQLTQANYTFDEFKSTKHQQVLEQVYFSNSQLTAQQIELLNALQSGQNLARDLGNKPGNTCYPEYLVTVAEELVKAYPNHLKLTVLDEQQIADLGMGAFLAVSQGSDRPGRIITLEYNSDREEAPVVLVGKAITFDTGGISLKPGAGMDEMKFDMGGGASVFGTLRAICEANLPIHVVGLIAAAENMPSAKATRPGDIVKTMSGQTVEILNTDAEGRLVLCDALTYVKRFNPAVVIDIATLTGACVVALGKILTGAFSPDDELIHELETAGETSFDRVWRLPVIDDYQDGLDSPFADIANITGPVGGGAISAACFLQRFTREYRWAHLDVAGTAWVSGAAKGSSGRPVPLLTQFIANRVK